MVVCSILFYCVKISYRCVSSLVYARLIRVMIHYRSPCFCTFVLSELYRVCLSFGYVSSCINLMLRYMGVNVCFLCKQACVRSRKQILCTCRSALNAQRYIFSISYLPSMPELRLLYIPKTYDKLQ